MNKLKQFFVNNFWLIIIFVAAILFRFILVFQPSAYLLTHLLPDDAFYYFVIAKNILAGLGSTFDGLNPANGFHPLWLIVILPIFKFYSLSELLAPIYAILSLSALLNILTGFVILAIIKRYTKSQAILALSLITWLLNPYNIYQNLNGLETSLSLLFIAWLILLAVKIKEQEKISYYNWAGIIGGLMMLARLDNLFYFVFFLLWLLVSQSSGKFKKIFLSGSLATIVVLPWLIWNIVSFNTIIPSSGAAFTVVNHALIVQDHGPALAQKIKASIYTSYNEILNFIRYTGAPEIALILFGMFLGWLLLVKNILFNKKYLASRPEIYFFIGWLAIFFLNASIRWTAREWYFISFNIFLAIFLAWFLEKIKVLLPYKKILYALLMFLIIASFYIHWSRYLAKGWGDDQLAMRAASLWANDNLKPGTKIGAFNSGIQGFYSTQKVINLDGLVNNNAYAALKQRKLWDYMKREKIEYLIDFDVYLDYRYKSFFGENDFRKNLELVKTIDNIKIFKIKN